MYRLRKNVPRFVEIIPGIQQAIDLRAIFGPLLHLVKIAVVRVERIVCLFVGPIVHATASANTRQVKSERAAAGNLPSPGRHLPQRTGANGNAMTDTILA
jgi:hypothetical protein